MRRTFSHVGIYVGDGKFIHSPQWLGSAREDMRQSYRQRRFDGARRSRLRLAPRSARWTTSNKQLRGGLLAASVFALSRSLQNGRSTLERPMTLPPSFQNISSNRLVHCPGRVELRRARCGRVAHAHG